MICKVISYHFISYIYKRHAKRILRDINIAINRNNRRRWYGYCVFLLLRVCFHVDCGINIDVMVLIYIINNRDGSIVNRLMFFCHLQGHNFMRNGRNSGCLFWCLLLRGFRGRWAVCMLQVMREGEKNHKKGGLNCVFGNFFFYVLDNCPQVQSLK